MYLHIANKNVYETYRLLNCLRKKTKRERWMFAFFLSAESTDRKLCDDKFNVVCHKLIF